MLECEFEETLCLRPELQTHLLVEIGPLRTKDALYDGRTEVMRLHYRVKEGGEETTVRRRNEPLSLGLQVFQVSVGHFTIHVNCADIEGMLRKEGLIKCTVLPSRDLYLSESV